MPRKQRSQGFCNPPNAPRDNCRPDGQRHHGDPTSSGGGIEIIALKRDFGQLVTLRSFLVNTGAEEVSVAKRLGGTPGAGASGGSHPLFGRQDANLTVTVPVTYPEAVLGAKVKSRPSRARP